MPNLQILIYVDVRPTAKSAKILSRENFPLYGIHGTLEFCGKKLLGYQ